MPAAAHDPNAIAIQCGGCGAQILIEAGLRTGKCPYCASPAVIERPVDPARPEPTFALGFVVGKARALDLARAFIRRPLFAPGKFRRAEPSDVRGLYLPAYIYTAMARADYRAQIGEHYTVTETYTTRNAQGHTVTRTRTRTETEWRDLTGDWAGYIDDVVVTASRGLPNAELQSVEPFDLRALLRFTPKLLSGWMAEDPSMSEAECRQQARAELESLVGARLTAHMPGDKHRDLNFRWRTEHEDLELVMLPVWVLAVRYDDGKPPVRLVVNGQTGKLGGRAPASWQKIVFTILAFIAVITAIVLLGALR